MMLESLPLLVAMLSFGTVAAVVFVVGQYVWTQTRLQRRLAMPVQAPDLAKGQSPSALGASNVFECRLRRPIRRRAEPLLRKER